jgi:predicted phage replisome organizer
VSDIKKYYYLKLKDNFFDSEEIKILESQPNGIYYSNLLIKLYLKSLKYNGALRFNEYIPYDETMIATITNLNIDIVKRGLQVLSSIKLIERLDDGTIYMMNIQSFIGKSNSEADRKRLYRERIEEEKLLLGQMSAKSPKAKGTSLDNSPPKIEKEIKIEDIDRVIDIDRENITSCSPNSAMLSEAEDLLKYFESSSDRKGALNIENLELAVLKHGSNNVKKAMDIALRKDKPNITYINGILKNWSKEGYPKEGEYNVNRITNEAAGTAAEETSEFSGYNTGFHRSENRELFDEDLI